MIVAMRVNIQEFFNCSLDWRFLYNFFREGGRKIPQILLKSFIFFTNVFNIKLRL